MKILITGASGFIGSFLIEEALKRGYDTYAGIRDSSDLKYLKDERIKFFKPDLSSTESIKNSLRKSGKFDFVIHNAGLTKTCRPKLFDVVNFQYTKNLLDALIDLNFIPRKIVVVSSLASYGPGNEFELEPVNVTDVPRPVSKYGNSKLKMERYLQGLSEVPYLIFRPTGVYGPRERDFYIMYKTINAGFETYIGQKEQYLTFIFVKDLSRLFFDALESKIINKNYFVSDLKFYTAVGFNEVIKKALGKKTRIIVFPKILVKILAVVGEKLSCLFLQSIPTLNIEKFKEISQKNWMCDCTNLERDFGFKPMYSLEKGMKETIEWYKKEKLL